MRDEACEPDASIPVRCSYCDFVTPARAERIRVRTGDTAGDRLTTTPSNRSRSITEITRMSNKIVKPLTLALGAAFVGSMSLAQMAQASSTFQLNTLVAPFAAAGTEGKCGEGKCGVAKMDTNKDGKVEMSEAMAGGFSESQVKAWDKDADGSLDANELKAMHAIMDGGGKKKGAEGSCGGDKKKGAEGSCGGSI